MDRQLDMSKNDKKKPKLISTSQTITDNRKAKYEYHIEDKYECGIMLTGSEVKSLRRSQCSINEAHAAESKGDIWLYNLHIAENSFSGKHLQHDPKRPRKLLLHRKEINKLMGAVCKQGYTIIPIRIYFNERGVAKVEIALARGKKLFDKRATEKERDWSRQKQKLLKDNQ